MVVDDQLIQQLEELCDGENVHLQANLIGTYRVAVAESSASGSLAYLELAEEAERELRALLFRLRLKRSDLLLLEA